MTTKATLILSATLLFAGCATPAGKEPSPDQERIAALRKEADSGSAVAAYRVFLLSARRDTLAMKYLSLAADGYVPAMSALGAILLESEDADDRAAGERYLRMAALSGDVDAKRYLELRGVTW